MANQPRRPPLVEAFEESGLRLCLVRHLVNPKRSQSYTRYVLAERIGGSPADMGGESQPVILMSSAMLAAILNSPYDRTVLEMLGIKVEPEWNRGGTRTLHRFHQRLKGIRSLCCLVQR